MTYNPLSITPLAKDRVPFHDAKPSKFIWVSPNGSDSNSGSQGSPLKTIQASVNKMEPGTAVMVKAGTYRENVRFEKSGTPDKPVWLVSADGIGAAKIVGRSGEAVVSSYGGRDNIVIKGLDISKGREAIEIMGSIKNSTKNVVIQDNIFHHTTIDGLKTSKTENYVIVGNKVFEVRGPGAQEGIDNVYMRDSIIAYNDVRGVDGYTGITAKAGASNVRIIGNHIEGTRDGISVGGNSTNQGVAWPHDRDFEARNFHVEGNEIHNVKLRAIRVAGAEDSVITKNLFNPNNDYTPVVWVARDNNGWESKNIKFIDNITEKSNWLRVESGSSVSVNTGNRTDGYWDSGKAGIDGQPRAGAPAPQPSEKPPVVKPPVPPAPLGEWKYGAAPTKWIYGSTQKDKVDHLTGTSGHDYLSGRSGADVMTGRRGDDTYSIGHPGDRAVERAGEGTDTALVFVSRYTLANHVENMVIKTAAGGRFTDNALDNVLTAGAGVDHFHFVRGNGDDLVRGFRVGQDQLHFAADLMGKLKTGADAKGNLVIHATAEDSVTLQGVSANTALADVV